MILRYGIIKRTKNLPLFHPYYLNYGGNKEEFYLILNTMGCSRWIDLMNRLSVFLNVCRFCYWSLTSTVHVCIVCFIDRSDYRTTWKRSRNYRPIVQMQHYMNRKWIFIVLNIVVTIFIASGLKWSYFRIY